MAILGMSGVCYSEESSSEYFKKDQERLAQTSNKFIKIPIYRSGKKEEKENLTIVEMVTATTKAILGPEWVPSAINIARHESSFNCNATGPRVSGGRAAGVFQVMPGSAAGLGYSYHRLHECQYGIDAGVAHMKQCIDKGGVQTYDQMSACHVNGWAGWKGKNGYGYSHRRSATNGKALERRVHRNSDRKRVRRITRSDLRSVTPVKT